MQFHNTLHSKAHCNGHQQAVMIFILGKTWLTGKAPATGHLFPCVMQWLTVTDLDLLLMLRNQAISPCWVRILQLHQSATTTLLFNNQSGTKGWGGTQRKRSTRACNMLHMLGCFANIELMWNKRFFSITSIKVFIRGISQLAFNHAVNHTLGTFDISTWSKTWSIHDCHITQSGCTFVMQRHTGQCSSHANRDTHTQHQTISFCFVFFAGLTSWEPSSLYTTAVWTLWRAPPASKLATCAKS